MPELPEVETMRRGIASIVGGKIVAVEHRRLALARFSSPPPAQIRSPRAQPTSDGC